MNRLIHRNWGKGFVTIFLDLSKYISHFSSSTCVCALGRTIQGPLCTAASPGQSRRIRLHRAILQSQAAALDARLSQSDGVRNAGRISVGWCQLNRQQLSHVLIGDGEHLNNVDSRYKETAFTTLLQPAPAHSA